MGKAPTQLPKILRIKAIYNHAATVSACLRKCRYQGCSAFRAPERVGFSQASVRSHSQRQQQPQPIAQLHAAPEADGSRRRDVLLALFSVAVGLSSGLGPGELRAWATEGISTSVDKALSLGFGADPGVEIVEADVTKGVDALVAAIGRAQAVVCATGSVGFGPNGTAQVDEQGTINLVDAALRTSTGGGGGVRKFVLVSSLLTNAAAVGQAANPNYVFLNIFGGGVLDRKLKAEKYVRASGLNFTIIRPGGLSNEPEAAVGNLIVAPEDSLFGLDGDPGRTISRDTVAAVAVQAVLQPNASRNQVLEVVASPSAPRLAPEMWFAAEAA